METQQERKNIKTSSSGQRRSLFFSPIPVQTKLKVNEPGDKFEQEADATAEQVVNLLSETSSNHDPAKIPSSTRNDTSQSDSGVSNLINISTPAATVPPFQAKCGTCEAEEMENPQEEEIQRMPESQNSLLANAGDDEEESTLMAKHGLSSLPTVSDETASQLYQSKGSGEPLPKNTKTEMERSFGLDFSQVRTHTGPSAEKMSKNLGAQAFAHGSDIYFNSGKYDTQSDDGKRLLAHELTHVVQQNGGASTHIQRFEADLHEAVELQGLTGRGGLTLEEANATYFGNWMRDMNQAFVPALEAFGIPPDATFAVISYMAAMKFGRTISPQQLGYYIAAEHLDNPAGLLPATQEITDQYLQHPVTRGGPDNPVVNPGVPAALSAQQDTSAEATVGGMGIHQVDQHGVMGFIHRSVQLVEQRMQLAVSRGRNPDGLAHLGAGLHTVEDFFAHSNWVEIAVQSRLNEFETDARNHLGIDVDEVFNYAPVRSVGSTGPRNSRPVLTTGTFAATDTQVSIGSELVAILRRPLPSPGTSAQSQEAERFTATMLDTFSARLEADEDLRHRIRDGLSQIGMPGQVADRLLRLPIGEIYRWTRIPLPGVLDRWRIWVGTQIHDAMSQLVLQPLADRIAGEALDARVADTPQLNVLRDSRATAADTSQGPQERQTARRRATQLGATPVSVVAGPSHSQLAKDHTNSPFFGLAFALASEAVRRIRVEVMAAWGASTAFDFSHGSFPASLSGGAQADVLERQRQSALFHEGRTQRMAHLRATSLRGRHILNQGGEGEAYNLTATRQADATQIRRTAQVLTTIGRTPRWAVQSLRRMRSLVSQLGDTRLARAEAALRQAGSVASDVDADDRTAAVRAAGVELTATADLVEVAQTRRQRLEAQQAMDTAYGDILSALSLMPGNMELHSIILSTVDRQRSLLDPAFSPEQRALLERIDMSGRLQGQTPTELTNAPALQQGTYTDPTSTGTTTDRVIAEIRMIMAHPYDSNWWHSLVDNYVHQHTDRLAVDIEARNEGIAFLRRPGESEHAGHQH